MWVESEPVAGHLVHRKWRNTGTAAIQSTFQTYRSPARPAIVRALHQRLVQETQGFAEEAHADLWV